MAVNEPLELCERIILLRQYARVKQQMDQADHGGKAPTGPLADLVLEIEQEQMQAERARKAKRAERRKQAKTTEG